MFKEKSRELINPLASDEHLVELLLQLQLMGEVVLIETGSSFHHDDDLLCFNPDWLCTKLLGRLFTHERFFNVKPTSLNGLFTKEDLVEIYADLFVEFDLLKEIFIAFDLCAELESSSSQNKEILYEFPALNFFSEPLPVAFHTLKSSQSLLNSSVTNIAAQSNSSNREQTFFVFNGFQIKSSLLHLNKTFDFVSNLTNLHHHNLNAMTASMTSSFTQFSSPPHSLNLNLNNSSQLAYLFFRIQIHLRLWCANQAFVVDLDNEDLLNNNQSNANDLNSYNYISSNSKYSSLKGSKKNSFESNQAESNYFTSQYIDATINHQNTKVSKSLSSLANSSLNRISNGYDPKLLTAIKSSSVDIDLHQTRYCTRLVRKSLNMECLIILDHLNGEFIEFRACAPDQYRDELFFFIEELYALVKQVIGDSCPGINLEKHYLSFKPVGLPSSNALTNLGIVSYDHIYSPKDIIVMQYENKNGGWITCSSSNSNIKSKIQVKFADLVCCGSERVEKSLIYGIEVPITQMSEYTRRMVCVYLDKVDPMGRDWSILAFLLGLQDVLPLLEETINSNGTHLKLSKCDYVLTEWSKLRPDQATIRNLINKINDLDRKDVNEIILSTNNLYQHVYVSTKETSNANGSNRTSILNSSQMINSLK